MLTIFSLLFVGLFGQFSRADNLVCEKIFLDPSAIIQKSILAKPFEIKMSQTAEAALKWISGAVHTTISSNSSLNDRYNAIKNVPLDFLIAAPGHNLLRNQEQIDSLKDYIQKNDQGNFEHDKILLNIINNESGKIISIDIWNAHHRLIAYAQLGYKTIGDLKIKNLEVLVNGVTEYGHSWMHYLPASGLNISDLYHNHKVYGDGVQPNTIGIPGKISNFNLGSRTTLKDQKEKPATGVRVGVFFGTFDPIHEGHIATAKKIIEQFDLNEIVFVHNVNPLHKPNATSSDHRFNMAKLRLENEKKLNLYQGDSDFIIREFGKDLIFDELKQVYATENIFEILGDDAYLTLLNLNQLYASNRHYIVMPRDVSSHIPVPEYLKNVVSEATHVSVLSSTSIRNKIKNGEKPNDSELWPVLYDYIMKNNLYKDGKP